MKTHIAASLVGMDCNKDKTAWYWNSEKNTKTMINDKDIFLLISSLRDIIKKKGYFED